MDIGEGDERMRRESLRYCCRSIARRCHRGCDGEDVEFEAAEWALSNIGFSFLPMSYAISRLVAKAGDILAEIR